MKVNPLLEPFGKKNMIMRSVKKFLLVKGKLLKLMKLSVQLVQMLMPKAGVVTVTSGTQ